MMTVQTRKRIARDSAGIWKCQRQQTLRRFSITHPSQDCCASFRSNADKQKSTKLYQGMDFNPCLMYPMEYLHAMTLAGGCQTQRLAASYGDKNRRPAPSTTCGIPKKTGKPIIWSIEFGWKYSGGSGSSLTIKNQPTSITTISAPPYFLFLGLTLCFLLIRFFHSVLYEYNHKRIRKRLLWHKRI